jgi:flagellar assembly factor FliW
MHIFTPRFGSIDVQVEDVLSFPSGLLGLENCRQWLLVEDVKTQTVAWLQSVERPEIAMAVTSPGRFVPDYQIKVTRRELVPLELAEVKQAEVLSIVGKIDHVFTLNLKAPLIINPSRRLGRQVVVLGEWPFQYTLTNVQGAWKKIA